MEVWRELKAEDLAYLAGFFDGEGSVGIYKNKSKAYLQASVVQNDKTILYSYMVLFGGRIYELGRSKLCFLWRVRSKRARIFLTCLLPYLKLKKSQAIVAIDFQTYREAKWGKRGETRLDRELSELLTDHIKGIKAE